MRPPPLSAKEEAEYILYSLFVVVVFTSNKPFVFCHIVLGSSIKSHWSKVLLYPTLSNMVKFAVILLYQQCCWKRVVTGCDAVFLSELLV